MNKYILLFLLAFKISSCIGQNSDPTYLWHDYIFDDLYIVHTLEIHTDSTYTSKDWGFEDSKEWPTYKQLEPNVKNGRIERQGKYFRMIEFKNGKEVYLESRITLNKRMLISYYPNADGKLVPQGRYKRIN